MAPAAADLEFIWRCPMSLVRRNKSTQSSFLYHLLHSSLKWNWKIGPQGNSPAGGGWRVDGGVGGWRVMKIRNDESKELINEATVIT